MASMVRTPRILQKFYIYDPNVPDILGGMRVHEETDDKGNVKENTKHVLAVTQQVQYWIDQGLVGEKPVGQISAAHKKLLSQVTRGRSDDNESMLPRIPKYDRKIQSGHPGMAGHPAMTSRKKRRKVRAKDSKKDDKTPKKPEPKAAM